MTIVSTMVLQAILVMNIFTSLVPTHHSDAHNIQLPSHAHKRKPHHTQVMEDAEYDHKVDVYSFGIVLTELLTRRLPFYERTDFYTYNDVVDAVLDEGIFFLSTTREGRQMGLCVFDKRLCVCVECGVNGVVK